MKSFLFYIFKSYLLTVVSIISITLLETIISNHIDNTVDESTPFDSPIVVSLICGILYPIYNLPVIIILYKYRLNAIEIVLESICLINVIAYISKVIEFFVPSDLLWHKTKVLGEYVREKVWWYDSDWDIIYGIIITALLCLLYIKIKRSFIKHTRIRRK